VIVDSEPTVEKEAREKKSLMKLMKWDWY
jgi:hypothetical protein